MSGQSHSGDLSDNNLDRTSRDSRLLVDQVEKAAESLLLLGSARGDSTAIALSRLIIAIADEAARSARFASSINSALSASVSSNTSSLKRSNRRSPGAFDPFLIYGDGGEERLREQLIELDLDQLRDIVAEHGMDNDRLAMKWKDPVRVVNRIVERVMTRHAKGSAFRT